MSLLAAIESLKGREDGAALAAEVAKLKEGGVGGGYVPVTDGVFADLEVAFRGALGARMRKGGDAGIEGLVQLALGYAEAEAAASSAAGVNAAPPTGKLPFLLFEDLVEASPLESSSAEGGGCWSARRAWGLLEALSDPLCGNAGLFARGKLPLLRLCNGLLKRLSKTLDTEWCGSVLMFLTAAYPLSERSAVNVKGEVNAANVTEVEAKAKARFGEAGGEAGDEDDEEEDDDDEADQLEEQEALTAEAAKTAALAAAERVSAAGGGGEGGLSVDYALYQSLWGLQRWLGSPNLALASAHEWEAFSACAAALLEAFEFYAFKVA